MTRKRGARALVRDVDVDYATALLRDGEPADAVVTEFTAAGHSPDVARATVVLADERVGYERERLG